MSAHGEITAWLGRQLKEESLLRSYSVYYDHGVAGEKGVCEISSVIGSDLRRENKISEIDIAILDRSERVIFLIEIEESEDNPKKLVVDVITTLLGDKIFINGIEKKQIGDWTTLIVFSKKTEGYHEKRIGDLEKRIGQLISNGETNGLKIKNIQLALFEDKEKLKDQVIQLIFPNK